ncbi:PglZ domain-containing protein [uncultured Cytophaga sp.]|uniref:T9SS response regulator signal transducer PorX n=1 Tax=uncultured Cytophaga sp. TaxID=160238 RepID=UPI00260881F7|nr:PglZ domain-containing protein [uncultured Cytophaga sp.]
MQKYHILWADDEIDLLKPHIIFLNNKGYEVTTVTNGIDALELSNAQLFDIIFLDENMPGLSGLETLVKIKELRPLVPVVMITKNEEEHIMEEAIGSKIADYLIKPINPNQILMSIKKLLQNKVLVNDKTTSAYRQEFASISMTISDKLDYAEWIELYKKIVRWEIEIESVGDSSLKEILLSQKSEGNQQFFKTIKNNYEDWINESSDDKPVFSHTVFRKKILPILKEEKVFVLLIDNLRYDQWKILEPLIAESYKTETEELYYSILPTTTMYARNAFFAGMMPSEIEKKYPGFYNGEEDELGKNNMEEQLLQEQLKKNGLDIKFSYQKITTLNQGKALCDGIKNILDNPLNVVVYNFVDMLSHARSDMEVLKELAPDEAAYRSITASWFKHSPLQELIQILSHKKIKLVITTDHGTIRVSKGHKIVGDKTTNTNMRYKVGKNLGFDASNYLMEVKKPEKIFLPKVNMSDAYVFVGDELFFVYPNNYQKFVQMFKDTFQHGGISMEEMLIPFIILEPNK